MWSLALPYALLLLPLPLLARRVLRPAEITVDALIVPPTIAARLGRNTGGRFVGSTRIALPVLLWVCLVLALAGPQLLTATKALPASGRDIVLALDLSGSMEIEDFELDGQAVQRLAAVKHVAAQFARGRQGDRLALVIFGEDAYFATPMTYDTEAVARAIEEAEIGISGRSTAISDGLGLAMKRLANSPAKSRVIILLSDGRDTSGTVAPVGAAQLARDLGIRVHSIAMGVTAIGEAGANRDFVDAATLKSMAEATGGSAFRVRSTADLETVSADIGRMETDPHDRPPIVVYRPYWTWPAAVAFVACLLIVSDRGRGA